MHRSRRRRLRSRLGLLVVALLVVSGAAGIAAVGPAGAATPTPWPGGVWQPDPVGYGMKVVSNVSVRMDDGVILYANVGYPTDPASGKRAAGTFPVLLTQNPYAGPTEQPDPFYVDRGYIFVSVGIRGTLTSKAPHDGPLVNGLFSPRQTRDGVELVDWVAHRLSGSNGVVGLTGCSQLGIDQLFTAAALGPHSPVKAILPACASDNYGIYFAGGIPGPTIGFFGLPAATAISGTKHLAENVAFGVALRKEVFAGGARAYNSLFWRLRTTTASMAQRIVHNDIPALLWSGWNAPDATGSLEFYAALQNSAVGRPRYAAMTTHQHTSGRYQIVVGPWGHGQGLDESIELEWYDTWLKGETTGVAATNTSMHLYENGSNEWVNTSSYPLAANDTPYYLSGHRLASTPTSSVEHITWGQPTTSGTTTSFTTTAFASGAQLAGPISASVYATSSNRNVELLATLFDVAPGGKATQITSGALLGSLHQVDKKLSWYDASGHLILPVHPYARDSYVSSHRLARYDIKLNPSVWSLASGHSLRLVLGTQQDAASCSSFDTLLAPAVPCTLTTPQQRTLAGGKYRVVTSAKYPSALYVPLVPAARLPVAASGVTPTSGGLTEPLDWSSP